MKAHKIFIGGLQGSGKSVYAQHIMRTKFKRPIALRITKDYDKVKNVLLVDVQSLSEQNIRDSAEAVAKVLCEYGEAYANKQIKQPVYDAFFIDEADIVFNARMSISGYMNKLVTMHRHYGLAIVFITRRPQDIPAKIVDSCRYRIFYAIEGKNVIKYIYDINPKVAELVQTLDYKSHRYVYQEIGETPQIRPPVPLQ